MGKLIGVGGVVEIDEDSFDVISWSLSQSTDIQMVTPTNSNGWSERLSAINSGELSFSAFWDTDIMLLPTTFEVGKSCIAYCTIGNSECYFTVPGIISSFSVTNPTKSPVEFQCSIQNDGEITYTEVAP